MWKLGASDLDLLLQGLLGSFGLTEKLAGVNSALGSTRRLWRNFGCVENGDLQNGASIQAATTWSGLPLNRPSGLDSSCLVRPRLRSVCVWLRVLLKP